MAVKQKYFTGKEMTDKVYGGLLNAYYGSMLNEHQKELMHLYYDCDMSLAEISEIKNVTRQAIRDILARSTAKLASWEAKLGLIGKVQKIAEALSDIIETADKTPAEELKKDLEALLEEIKEI